MQTIPDFGVRPSQFPAPDYDNLELAARLGGIVSYRRTGRVLFRDSCVSLAPWVQLTAPVVVSNTVAFNGTSSFRLTPTAADECGIFKLFPAFAAYTIGLEFFFSLGGGTNILLVGLVLDRGPGAGNIRRVELEINRSAGTLSNSGVVFGSGIDFSNGPTEWDNLKIVADFSTNKLAKVFFNDVIYYPNLSLAAYAGVKKYMAIDIETPPDATPDSTYIDDITLTINEATT